MGTTALPVLAASTANPFLISLGGVVGVGTRRVPCGKSPTLMPLAKRSAPSVSSVVMLPFPRLIMMPPQSVVMVPKPGMNWMLLLATAQSPSKCECGRA